MRKSILLLAILLLQLPAVLLAEDHGDFTPAHFFVSKTASVQIGESAQITISGSLVIESDISGKGKIILLSDKKSFIDGNGYSIENLVLASANPVELISDLRIINELSILKGALRLNDFNLIINWDTKLNQSTLLKIIQNGTGTILQESISIPHAAIPFVLSAPVHFDFSTSPALTVKNRRNSSDTIFYYQLPFIPNRTIEVLVPPPKA